MNALTGWLGQSVASCLIVFLVAPYGAAATRDLPSAPEPSPQVSVPANTRFSGGSSRASVEDVSYAENSKPRLEIAQQTPESDQTKPSRPVQQTPASKDQTSTHPVGTAAAPAIEAKGVAASRPAGAAIAPAKQRRVRTLAIRIGLLVGAAVAVGTITALSMGSSSRPN